MSASRHSGTGPGTERSRRPVRTMVVALAAWVLVLASCSGDDDGGGVAAGGEFCERARAAEAAFADQDVDPQTALEALRSLAEVAPGELADDMDVVIRYTEALAEDPASLADAPASDLEAAFDSLDAYLRDTCGIDIGTGDDESGSEDGARPGAEETITVNVAGDYNGEDTFTGIEVSCTWYQVGEMGVMASDVDDTGDRWSVEIDAELPPGDRPEPGEYPTRIFVVYPPDSTGLPAEGDSLVARDGTLVLTEVGEVIDGGETGPVIPVRGTFEAETTTEVVGGGATVTGTFDCLATVG